MSNVIETLVTLQQEDPYVRVVVNVPDALYTLSRGEDRWKNALREILGEIPEDVKSRAANALLAGDTRMFKDLCKIIAEKIEVNHPDVYYTALGWGNP